MVEFRLKRMFGFAAVCFVAAAFFFSCKKDEPVTPAPAPVQVPVYTLAGQTWLLYKYADSIPTDTVAASDTLRFTDAHNLSWNDSACTYLLWRNTDPHNYSRGLTFYNTPIDAHLMNYGSQAAFSQDSLDFEITFGGIHGAFYLWFRRL